MTGRGQRRPALGLRPWFALRRRARLTRRDFFAMGEESSTGAEQPANLPRRRRTRVAIVEGGRWTSPPVIVATTFMSRWRGLCPEARGRGLLVRTRSVHAFGMRHSLMVIILDDDGTVRGSRLLRPGRRLHLGRTRWLLELPPGASAPRDGVQLEARPMLAPCPAP